jgi:hypothetical protein
MLFPHRNKPVVTLFTKIWKNYTYFISFVFYKKLPLLRSSVADPDPGSGAFLAPGFGIRKRFFPDPGSQTHIFESLVTIFG